jgi:chromosome segregation protein
MRLKHLELLGYKTFAAQTEFLFDAGITAIVGPNGSGKSNIADAVRWVLGEQSFSLLRAKRSEDMIFAGSERRARMGMAEATITLDNSDQWLPIDFEEVSITRRAHRSGENEYLLNGSRVRHRDISDILAKSGLARRTYTVIGQGLIDAALSLRPQERRSLIEEAAGLTLYQSRRADALEKLDETNKNITRVHDLIAEITPRLGRLRRQAERAEEYALIRRELDKALRTWYGFEWKRGQDELTRRRTIERYQLGRLNAQRASVRELGNKIDRIRERQNALRQQLGAWHRESSALHTRAEALQRDLAVLDERRRLLIDRRQQGISEIAPLQASHQAQQEQLAAVQDALARLEETLDEQQASVAEANAALNAHQQQLASLQTAEAAARGDLLTLRAQIADSENRQAQMQEQQQQLQSEQRTHQAESRALQDRLSTLHADLEAVKSKAQAFGDKATELGQERTRTEQQIAAIEHTLRGLEDQRNDLETSRGRLEERYTLLTRMHQEGEGLYDGVRSVLRLAAEASLQGIVGTVAELIQVPRELETAIEVALGSQLQNVVVETWQNAQAAIDHLKRTRSGRATFLPLDTLRPGQPIRPPQVPGVIGIASELVSYEAKLQPVAAHLLGRTIVCQDLTVARQVLSAERGGYQIVTPEGELVRSSGSVTGGRARQRRDGGILARERERRELPEQLRALKRERQALHVSIQEAGASLTAQQDQRAALLEQIQTLETAQRTQQEQAQRFDQEIESVSREHDWHTTRASAAARQLVQLQQRETELKQRTQELQILAANVEARLAEIAARIERHDDQELAERLAARRAQVAATQQQQAARQAERVGYQRSMRQVADQIASRQRQSQELQAELEQTAKRIDELNAKQDALRQELERQDERITPAENELEAQEKEQNRLEKQERFARTRLQDLETQHSRVQLQVTRQEDHMASLRQQIERDFGLVELDMGQDLSGQPLLPMGSLVSSLPKVEALPEGLEEQIQSFRRRMRRLEPINPDAPAEYAEADQRHAFLSEQAQDLERAIADLRQVIAELDEVMEREFKRTFGLVARQFRSFFQELFGGGSARLELTDPEDLMGTGIDIVARPPGKRQQGLALLSGGERALTATALVFAIMSTGPTPFCVLDEVDAALDEANVGRFRTVLQSLAQETQFVIITHNRYTIEIADIVYGVTMSGDGSSRVISHRLSQEPDEQPAATPAV